MASLLMAWGRLLSAGNGCMRTAQKKPPKDMSRLGRDYLKVGQIMEILRQRGVRLIAINAVSYTHLDVYKRQVYHGKTGFKATSSENKDSQHVGRKRGI